MLPKPKPTKPTRPPTYTSGSIRTAQQPGQTAVGALIKRNPLTALAALAAKAKGKGRAK